MRSVDPGSGWRRYPTGSPEHYAGYEREFTPEDSMPSGPRACYEIDYSYELADEAHTEALYEQHVEETVMPLLYQAESATLNPGIEPAFDPRPGPEPEPEIDLF